MNKEKIEQLNRSLDSAYSLNNLNEAIQILKNLSQIYADNGDTKKAVECNTQILKIAEKNKDSDNMIMAHNNIGLLYMKHGDNNKALKHFNSAEKISQTSNDDKLLLDLLQNTEKALFAVLDLKSLLDVLLNELKIVEKICDVERKKEIILKIAQTYLRLNDESIFIKVMDIFIKNIQNIENNDIKTKILLKLAQYYANDAKHKIALQFYIDALRISEIEMERDVKLSIIIDIAHTHTILGNMEDALRLYSKGLEMAENLARPQEGIRILNNLIKIYEIRTGYNADLTDCIEKRKEWMQKALIVRGVSFILEKARKLSEKGKDMEAFTEYAGAYYLARKSGMKSLIALTSCARGDHELKSGSIKVCLQNYEQAAQLFGQSEDFSNQAIILGRMAKVHHKLGNLDKARQNVDEAIQVYTKRNIPPDENTLEVYHELYKDRSQ